MSSISYRIKAEKAHCLKRRKLSGPLCGAVTGNNNSGTLLKTLSKSNSFVILLDSAGGWYRYHPLFQEFLLVRLNEEDERARRRLSSLAGEWYLSSGFAIDAVNCLLDAGEYERVYPYISGYRQEEMVADYSMWRKWIDRIPETLYEDDPTVYTSYSWVSSMEHKTDEAELWTQKTRVCFERIKWNLIPEKRNYVEVHVHVSLSTVKQHNNKIFDKLGVKNRLGAVARAKGLGLINK